MNELQRDLDFQDATDAEVNEELEMYKAAGLMSREAPRARAPRVVPDTHRSVGVQVSDGQDGDEATEEDDVELTSQVPGAIADADEETDDELDLEEDEDRNSLADMLEWGSETATTPPSEGEDDMFSDPATPSLHGSDE